ncbi:MAG: DUF502 domain-containing protein [Thermodesulfovibrionia bacterium]|nr:DUF502 domain-containing protein [Thermodesulfovibrionia bacterium]
MNRLKAFLKTSLLGGVVVILPVAILIMFFKWLFGLVTGMIQPLTDLVMETMYISKYQRIFADLMVLATIVLTCFFVGIFVKTRLGIFIHKTIEEKILKVAPGYTLIKDTVMQFLGGKKAPFSSVALVRVFGTDALFIAFITDSHPDGSYTVFIPTAPNPTSGNICHLKSENVYLVDVPVEQAMRSVISCGAGSAPLIESMLKKMKEKEADAR